MVNSVNVKKILKMKYENLLVFKTEHGSAINFVLKKEDGSDLAQEGTIPGIARAIRQFMERTKGNPTVNIDCSPDCEISVSYGKNPIYNQSLSEDEELELYKELHLK